MAATPVPLAFGSAIGILGGGQLGRMLAVAASRLGYPCHIYDPDPAAPAGQVAARLTTAPYTDLTALRSFADSVAIVTYEFENIPTAALDAIEALRPIHPNRRALATSQDRIVEKTFLRGIGLTTAPFAPVTDAASLDAALAQVGTPAILKTTRLGYDGKGQARIMSAARGQDGSVAAFDPGENVHRDGILRTTTIPATLTPGQRTDAVLIAARILNALDYVGVMGVELFVTSGGLVVNEIAPRVHNSGHWTQNACAVDQFEQHIRAVAGLPLGDGSRFADCVMENLIGDDIARIPGILRDPKAALHLYGKGQARAGRKMGHVNRVTALR
jgi:5-(carboxyamino)imidazole ribonucleotide synthase